VPIVGLVTTSYGVAVKPLIYGYLRVEGDTPDDDVDQVEQQMMRAAEVEGFCYATTFYEYLSGSHAAFLELIETLKRADARHVIVPSLSHLSTHPMLQDHLLERLSLAADAYVVALDELSPIPTAAERSLPDDNDSGRATPPGDG
jgi:Resolvase, N terminal domain